MIVTVLIPRDKKVNDLQDGTEILVDSRIDLEFQANLMDGDRLDGKPPQTREVQLYEASVKGCSAYETPVVKRMTVYNFHQGAFLTTEDEIYKALGINDESPEARINRVR